MSAITREFEHSLALPFFGIRMKTDLFQSCGHCWVFQICWHVECSTLIASSFRIWNSSAEIPSPSLDLLTAVLPKAYLTSHSRMSGSGWVTTPWWLSESLSFFVQFFHVFFPSLLDLFCFYYIFTVSIVYWAHLWMKFSFDIFNFLEEISSLSSRKTVLFSSISLYCSVKKPFL